MVTKSQVKYIQSLGQKKFRDEHNCFIAEGPKIVAELLEEMPGNLEWLLAEQAWMDKYASTHQLLKNAQFTVIDKSVLERISQLQAPNEVLAIFKKPVIVDSPVAKGFSLMLDGIQDPGNMGTLIRIADWFGIKKIYCSPDCADAWAPKVVQSTMGSIARIEIETTDLVAFAETNKSLPLIAAALNGKNLDAFSAPENGVLVIGNESKGIGPDLLAHCRHKVTIPRIGKAESLNAAVAAGVILSRICKPK